MSINIWKAAVHVILPIIAAIIINIIIYTQGWNDKNKVQVQNSLLPPGYAIAIIWVFILGLLGFTHYLVYPSTVSYFIIAVIIYCLAYPFLTSGLQANKGDVLNLITFVLAIVTAIAVFMKKKRYVLYVLPFVIWTAYVSALTILNMTK